MEHFFSLVEGFGYARGYARHILNETERLNIRQHGYGVRSFGRSSRNLSQAAGSLAHPAPSKKFPPCSKNWNALLRACSMACRNTQLFVFAHRMILFTHGKPPSKPQS